MTIEDIIAMMTGLEHVIAQTAASGDGSPEIAWGDTFFYYSPDGAIPPTQPFATIVTKDYPGNGRSMLDRPGAFRVNVAPGRAAFHRWAGDEPHNLPETVDASIRDVVIAHPVYGSLGWLAVVEPGPATEAVLAELLFDAYRLARRRYRRRRVT